MKKSANRKAIKTHLKQHLKVLELLLQIRSLAAL